MEGDVPDLIARLRKLTPREREALGWLCAGLTIAQIGVKMVCSKSNVLFHLTHVYEKLGLGGMTLAVRQREMGRVCIEYRRLSQADQLATSLDEPEAEPEAESQSEPEQDLTRVPQRALVAVLRDDDARSGANLQPPIVESVEFPAMPRQSRRWLPSLLILFGVALISSILTSLITALVLPGGRSLLVQEVVVTATPNLALAAIPPTRIVAATIAPRATAVPTALPTSTPVPSPTTAPTATALTGTRNLAGKVPDDIPGVLVAPGITISSVVDQHTKPRDVYAIRLAAGQVLQFSVTVRTALFSYAIEIADPDLVSFASSAWHGSTFCGYYNISCSDSFTPAANGTYYLAVVALDSNVPYTLRLNVR